MTIKPFAIQGADLTLGGVNLQAGTTGVVIPGVTQAVNYFVEEVERRITIGGNNPNTFGSNAGAITVIDNAEYLYLVDDGDTPSQSYVAATYSVDELDDGRIEEVDVESGGTFAAADKTRVEAADMWATTTPTPFATFNAANWTQIPYRPKMRAGVVENVGGGGSTGNFTFSDDTISNDNGLILSTDRGTLAIGTNMEAPGVAGHFHIGFNGSNGNPPSSDLFLGDDYNYVKLPGYELNPADHGVEIGTHDRDGGSSNTWRFGTDGSITFPDNTTQTTAYTGQGGGVTVSDVWIQTFVTDTPATDVVQVASSVEYDSVGNIIALFNHFDPSDDSTYYSVGKYTSTGTRIWTARFSDDFNTDGWGLAVDSTSGFVYIAGQTSTDGGQTNATLTKISGADGTIEWSKLYDFGFDSQSAVVDVASDGNPVMVGYASNINSRYVATTKVDEADGSIIWSRALDGQDDEQAYGMAVGPSGEIVVVGYMAQLGFTNSVETAVTEPVSNVNWVTNNNVQTNGVNFNVTFSAGVPTITINSDSTGNRSVGQTFATLLGSVFGGTNGIDDMVVKVATLAQPDLDDHMLVVKYDSLGELEWQKAVLFDNNYDSFGADADIDSEGNVYVTGMYEADIVEAGPDQLLSIFKLNSSGNKQWSRRLEGNCGAFAASIVVGPDDKLYISATTFAGTNPGDTDIHTVLAKYEFDGTVAWQRLIDYTDGFAVGSFFFGSNSGGSNLAVKQDYVAVGLGFGSSIGGPGDVHAAVAQVSTAGDLFTVGSWDFKQASFSGLLSSDASDIEVLNANKVNTDNASNIDTTTVTPMFDNSNNFLIGTLYSTAVTDDTVGFTILADGSLQARAGVTNTTVLTDSLLTGRPDWLTITPRSPDRDTLDTHYGFTSSGMWFTGNNEETLILQPAYPIHTTDSFSADTKVVVEFDINLVSGQEDWGVCVYPADGVPHWAWDPHPSRIAATVDCSTEPTEAQAEIHGFTNSNYGDDVSDFNKARFTYDPVAELTTLELINSDDEVTSRAQLPGRLARGQDYMIGFDADWDEPGVGDKSYFTNLTITSGNTAQVKATELTITGELKLPNTVKGFVNMVGPWANSDDNIQFQSVAAHDGYAYMIGEAEWAESNRIRIDKYSLTSGELVWTRVLGAGRDAVFDISWTGGAYTLTNIDNNGIGYQVGQLVYISGDSIVGGVNPTNLVTITITDVDDEGDIVTATIAGTAPSGTSSQAGLGEYNSDGRGDPTSIKYDTVTDTLVVLTDHVVNGDVNDNNWDRALITRINPVSGDVVSTVTLSDEGDIRPYDVAVHPTTGATAVVGEKYNEYRAFGTLTMAVKADGYFDILKSELDAEHYPGSGIPGEYFNDFWISGTGIANREFVDNVNYYAGLSGTTQQGSGATFNITNNGDGTYTAAVTAAVNTNYRVGHKIKILGTALEGATPDNDIIITVDAVTDGAITSVSNSGTAAGTSVDTTNAVSGTNYNVGSGLTVDITVDAVTGSRIATNNQQGSNYVANDVVIIPGTVFAGGATPANDVTVTIMAVEGTGQVSGDPGVVTAGTTPTNIVRIYVDGVDFTAVGGSWTMTQDLDGEAFVWTAAWNKAIGGASNDQFQSVVYSKDGTSIYAVGSGQYEVTHRQSLVVKFATSDGTIGFSKYLNSDTVDSYATGVATIGTSDIVVAGYEYNTFDGINLDQQFVARLTSSGTVVWKKFYGDGNWDSNMDNNCDIQVDSDDNIYVTMQEGADNPSFSNNGFHVTKLDQAGNLVWTRCVSGADSSYLTSWNGNRCSSLANDQLVVAGYTYVTDDDYYNGLWASFPTDGFTYFGGEDDFVQQGAFRISQGRLKNGVSTLDTGGSFTPSVQAPTITASNNLKKYETREPLDFFEQHLHKITDPKHGGLVFGDGSRQTFATDTIPQIKADYTYTITAQDSGKHIYYKNNSGTITIPAEDVNDGGIVLPVGFTFTIINRTGSDCFVRLYNTNGPTRGTILGAGRNISTWEWGIPDSGSGSMVTLIKLESLLISNEGSVIYEPVWMISGPGDIYDSVP